MINTLLWDSNFFGFRVGLINISDEPNWDNLASEFSLISPDFHLIYFVTTKNIHIPNSILKKFNGEYINQRVVYHKNIEQPKISIPEFITEYDSRELTNELEQLAYLSGSFSRFRIDKKMPPGKFQELYTIWIKSSIEKKIADKVFVSNNQDHISALITCGNMNSVCNIGLVAVNGSERGKGTGQFLINKVEEQAYKDSLTEVRVPTQSNNLAACTFYEKLGFAPFEISNYYHFWI